MTTINVDVVDIGVAEPVPAEGYFLVRLATIVLGDPIITTDPVRYDLVDGETVFELLEGENYRITARGLPGLTSWYFLIPSGGPYTMSELIEDHQIDPESLEPAPGPITVQQQLNDMQQQLDEFSGADPEVIAEAVEDYLTENPPASSGTVDVQDNGVFEAAADTINFIGAEVTNADGTVTVEFVGPFGEEEIQDLIDASLSTYATDADVSAAVAALINSAPGALNTLDELANALGDDASFSATVTTSLGLKAPAANPTFTGTVTVPDAVFTIAKTNGLQAALDLKANIASPTLTGTPAAPTAAANTNTTQIATTAYVQTELGDRPQSTEILVIDKITQAAYDALSPKIATTLYVIVG